MESRPSLQSPDVMILVPRSRLDASASPLLERALANCEAQGLIRIVLDFTESNYISSSSLRVILMHTRKLRRDGGDLKLCSLPDKIHQVLHITGLETILEVYANEELAVQAFGMLSRPTNGETSPRPTNGETSPPSAQHTLHGP